MVGTRSLLDFEYLHIHEIYWRWDPSLNMKLIYVSYTPSQSLKVILYNIFVHKKVSQKEKSFPLQAYHGNLS